jgi:hypothetical protein
MTEHPSDGADRVGHGEASLGEAQSMDPGLDPEMIDQEADDTPVGPEEPAPEERGNEDPAPNAP